jgi:hypothetical protein
MSIGAIELSQVEDGGVLPSEGHPDCPEPCGCEESAAMRELLETIVEYDEVVMPCDPWCKGECAFCKARLLLARLQEKRALRSR